MTRPDGGASPGPITDTPETEYWPPTAALQQNFGARAAGGLPAERFRRACRAQFRNLMTRWPRNCTCGGGLRVAYGGGKPENVVLTALHLPTCPRFVA